MEKWALVQSLQIPRSGSRPGCFSQWHPSAGCSRARHAGLHFTMAHDAGAAQGRLCLGVSLIQSFWELAGVSSNTCSGLTRTNKHDYHNLLETVLCEKCSLARRFPLCIFFFLMEAAEELEAGMSCQGIRLTSYPKAGISLWNTERCT